MSESLASVVQNHETAFQDKLDSVVSFVHGNYMVTQNSEALDFVLKAQAYEPEMRGTKEFIEWSFDLQRWMNTPDFLKLTRNTTGDPSYPENKLKASLAWQALVTEIRACLEIQGKQLQGVLEEIQPIVQALEKSLEEANVVLVKMTMEDAVS